MPEWVKVIWNCTRFLKSLDEEVILDEPIVRPCSGCNFPLRQPHRALSLIGQQEGSAQSHKLNVHTFF
jgi:hypothetical protein